MANKNIKADSQTALTARLAKKAKAKPPSIQDAARIVWDALLTVQEILKEKDVLIQLKAAHACFQGAQAFAKLHEVGELEARLLALEQALPGSPNISRLEKIA
jgi:hypothetical protein